jgi:chromosomal replication initiator protein
MVCPALSISVEDHEIILKYKKEIEEATGKECVILLVEKIDKLLPLLTLEEIATVVEKYIQSGLQDLKAINRNRDLVNLRKIYCLLAHKAGYSLREIGLFLNGRDHSTVIHNIEKAKDHLKTEQAFKNLFHWIQKDLVNVYENRLNNPRR